MLNKPTVVELLSKAENRYSLVIATAKRARQISQGSKPMTEDKDTSPITLAADEIDEGKLKIYDEQEWEAENKKVEENIAEDNKAEQNNDQEKESNQDSKENI